MARKPGRKLVLRKASPVTKAAIVAAVVLSTFALVALKGSIDQMNSQYDALRQQAMALESDNSRLEDRIENLGTLESAIIIAMEELGLTFPDSVLYVPGN